MTGSLGDGRRDVLRRRFRTVVSEGRGPDRLGVAEDPPRRFDPEEACRGRAAPQASLGVRRDRLPTGISDHDGTCFSDAREHTPARLGGSRRPRCTIPGRWNRGREGDEAPARRRRRRGRFPGPLRSVAAPAPQPVRGLPGPRPRGLARSRRRPAQLQHGPRPLAGRVLARPRGRALALREPIHAASALAIRRRAELDPRDGIPEPRRGHPRPEVRGHRRPSLPLLAQQPPLPRARTLPDPGHLEHGRADWARPAGIGHDGWLFWRPKTPDGGRTWYCPAYWHEHGRAALFRSSDGLAWEKLGVVFDGEGVDETDFEFLPDGRMLVTGRAEGRRARAMAKGWFGDNTGHTGLAVAPPPYDTWTYSRSFVTRLDGPRLFTHAGKVYAVGRRDVPAWKGLVFGTGSILNRKRTALFEVREDRLLPPLRLPERGRHVLRGGGDRRAPALRELLHERREARLAVDRGHAPAIRHPHGPARRREARGPGSLGAPTRRGGRDSSPGSPGTRGRAVPS